MSNLDLALNTSRDISVESHDLKLTTGIDLICQRLVVGLRLFRGEWFLAEEDGMPYYESVLVNAPRTSVIEALFRQAILADGDIEKISSLSMTTDRRARSLTVYFEAVSVEGIVLVSEVFP